MAWSWTTVQCLEEKTFPREESYIPWGKTTSRQNIQNSQSKIYVTIYIYALKKELLLDRFIMSDDERIMIHRMAKFISLFYTMQFLRSRISVFAPADKFKFFVAINWSQEED